MTTLIFNNKKKRNKPEKKTFYEIVAELSLTYCSLVVV